MSDFINAVKAPLVDDTIDHADCVIYTPSGSKDCVVLSVSLCNTTAAAVTVDLQLDASADAYFIKDVSVPGGSTLELMTGQKYVLKNGETLRGRCSLDSAVDCVVNGLEQT